MTTRINLAHLPTLLVLAGAVLGVACSGSHELDDAGVGGDASSSDGGARHDSGAPRDAGPRDAGPPPGACDPQRASVLTCPELLCDGLGSWHWNGYACFYADCGACTGPDCGLGTTTEEECVDAHASCESTLCRSTGGLWKHWAPSCGHYVCGSEPPAICESPYPVCDCGPTGRFDPTLGCVTDPSCPVPEPPAGRQALCEGTGGSWENICCDTVCGAFCPLACVGPACNCGDGKVFEEGRGCVESTDCFEPALGERCGPGAVCPAGSLCCQSCGGAGCFGDPVCRPPLCDDDETVDECGNNLLAP